MRLPGLLILCCALGGCYNPSYGDCQVSCASGACPAGLECQSGVCRAPGMTGPCAMTDAGGSGSDGGLSIDDIDQVAVEYLCKYAVRCGQFEDMPSCEMVYSNLITPQSDLIAAVKAGTVIFHGDKAQACFEARDSVGCERWKANSSRVIDPSCDGIYEGMRHDGEACAIDQQCISQTCNKTTCTMACCPGTCAGERPPGPRNVGESCTFRDRCQGSYCDQTTGVCAEYKTANMSCTYGDQCADELGCITGPQFPNPICAPLKQTNETCFTSAECLNTADVCLNGECMQGGLSLRPCQSGDQCQLLHACNANKCAPPPKINESCASYPTCMTGYCDFTNNVCAQKLANGSACDPTLDGNKCESVYCDGASGQCMDKPVCN